MYGIIRTNATLWAGNKIFYFQKSKKTRNKVDSEPKQSFSYSNLLTSGKKNSEFYFAMFSFKYNLDEM